LLICSYFVVFYLKEQIRANDQTISELQRQVSADKLELSLLKEVEVPELQRRVDDTSMNCSLAEELKLRLREEHLVASREKDKELLRQAGEYRKLKKEMEEEQRKELKQVMKKCQAEVVQKETECMTVVTELLGRYCKHVCQSLL